MGSFYTDTASEVNKGDAVGERRGPKGGTKLNKSARRADYSTRMRELSPKGKIRMAPIKPLRKGGEDLADAFAEGGAVEGLLLGIAEIGVYEGAAIVEDEAVAPTDQAEETD